MAETLSITGFKAGNALSEIKGALLDQKSGAFWCGTAVKKRGDRPLCVPPLPLRFMWSFPLFCTKSLLLASQDWLTNKRQEGRGKDPKQKLIDWWT